MSNFSKVLLIGRLTHDAALKQTPSKVALATFDLAINHKSPKASVHTDKETVCFVPVVIWDQLAENCAAHLKKGRLVFIEGRLKQNTWEKEAKKYSQLFVQATTVLFLSPQPAKEKGIDSDENAIDAIGTAD